MSNSLRPHGLQHARLPCPSRTPGAYSNSCPLSRWCHPTFSSSVVPFFSHLQSLPASGSFPMSQLFASGGQRIGISASASVLPMNIQWFPLVWTGWISKVNEVINVGVLLQCSLWPYKTRKRHQSGRAHTEKGQVMIQQEGSHLYTKARGRRRNQTWQHLDLRLLAFRTARK